MNELSLFTGAGGGLLAAKLLGWRSIGYVENEKYCQKIIRQRIDDGMLDKAPIFTDIRAFNRDGYAQSYQGMVDVISGGFPCQDISCAGSGAGINGEQSGLWFEMAETVRIVRPTYVFIENSPMLLVRGFNHVLSSLSEMGFAAAWGIISAADVGAPHLRKRIWIVAQSKGRFKEVANSKIQRRRKAWEGFTRSEKRIAKRGEVVPDTDRHHVQRQQLGGINQEERPKPRERQAGSQNNRNGWWATEPGMGRVAHGVANRVDRLRAIGNGQVPRVAEQAWITLINVLELAGR